MTSRTLRIVFTRGVVNTQIPGGLGCIVQSTITGKAGSTLFIAVGQTGAPAFNNYGYSTNNFGNGA